MAMTDNTPSPRPIERHIQTILTALILAILVWVGSTLIDVSEQQAVQVVQIQALNERIAEMKESTRDRYTRSDASRDKEAMQERMKSFERRLDQVESRIGG